MSDQKLASQENNVKSYSLHLRTINQFRRKHINKFPKNRTIMSQINSFDKAGYLANNENSTNTEDEDKEVKTVYRGKKKLTMMYWLIIFFHFILKLRPNKN